MARQTKPDGCDFDDGFLSQASDGRISGRLDAFSQLRRCSSVMNPVVFPSRLVFGLVCGLVFGLMGDRMQRSAMLSDGLAADLVFGCGAEAAASFAAIMPPF